jgi:hypothetical protein
MRVNIGCTLNNNTALRKTDAVKTARIKLGGACLGALAASGIVVLSPRGGRAPADGVSV